MSGDIQLSKSELSRQAEEYINHIIRSTPYDSSLSPCVVQVLSGNPLRISDATNSLEVSDPSVINNKLKEANKNVNWHTMRGAIISLTNWGFTSSYDSANDKLKFDIVIHDAECLQGAPTSNAVVPNSVSLSEAPSLKNKLNRLKKFYMADELNAHHPIETALDLIDRERTSASEMVRLADPSRLKGRNIGASLESAQEPQHFWEYIERANPEFPATEPIFEDQNRAIESISYKRQFQSLPDNQDMFPMSEHFEHQPTNPFQPVLEEDNLSDYLGELKNDINLDKKSQQKDRMEVEEEDEEDNVIREVPVAGSKRKLHDVLIQKKDSLGTSKQGVKKVFHGSALNSTQEQQKLMRMRDSKGPSEFDSLNLLSASIPQAQPQSKPSTAHRISEPKKGQRGYAPTASVGREVVEPQRERESYNPPVLKKPSPGVYFEEEVVVEKARDIPMARSKEKFKSPAKPTVNTYLPLPKTQQENRRKISEEMLELDSHDYFQSFKLVKVAPIDREEREARQVRFAPQEYQDEGKRSLSKKVDFLGYEEISFNGPSRLRSGKATPSQSQGLYAENPFDNRFLLDLSEYKAITFKPATTSNPLFSRK